MDGVLCLQRIGISIHVFSWRQQKHQSLSSLLRFFDKLLDVINDDSFLTFKKTLLKYQWLSFYFSLFGLFTIFKLDVHLQTKWRLESEIYVTIFGHFLTTFFDNFFDNLFWTTFLSIFGDASNLDTTDAQRRNCLHCTAKNSLPITNFSVQPKHIWFATLA